MVLFPPRVTTIALLLRDLHILSTLRNRQSQKVVMTDHMLRLAILPLGHPRIARLSQERHLRTHWHHLTMTDGERVPLVSLSWVKCHGLQGGIRTARHDIVIFQLDLILILHCMD